MASVVFGSKGFEELLKQDKEVSTGCLVDTSVFFALSYELDAHNDEAVRIFELLAKSTVSAFANVNVRSEFVDLHRRVAIPEALIDLLEDAGDQLDAELNLKLRSLRTRFRRAQQEDKGFKLSDNEIKNYRKLLMDYHDQEKDGWELFCQDYIVGLIQPAWDFTVDRWGLQFLSLRSTETHPLIESEVTWEGMVELVEKFGLGSNDAMILNLFISSKLKVLLTADEDLAYCAEKLNLENKVVVFI